MSKANICNPIDNNNISQLQHIQPGVVFFFESKLISERERLRMLPRKKKLNACTTPVEALTHTCIAILLPRTAPVALAIANLQYLPSLHTRGYENMGF